MGWIRYTAADYLAAMKAIMPSGLAWSDDPNGVMNQVLGKGLMPAFERVSDRAVDLLGEALPSSTFELLPEWEASVGLPDPCAGLSPTTELRRNQVVARLSASGGQSAQYFQALAANLGYAVTVTQFTASRFGRPFGFPFTNDAWANAWQVNAPTFTIERLTFGTAFGQPFASWGNTVLQCELARVGPAHAQLIFSYD